MRKDPIKVARWRFEQISVYLDSRLTPEERSRLLKEASQIPILWLSGNEKPISRSTLYRWLTAYLQNPVIEALRPTARLPAKPGTPRVIKIEWVTYALALLEEEPARSLFFLGERIKLEFALDSNVSASSLHRALKEERRYLELRRRATDKSTRLRSRFEAIHPHDIWRGDGKGPFKVVLADGTMTTFSIVSILDDSTRYILASLVVLSESTASVVSTFRKAAARWGLCRTFYADLGSCYDSDIFRQGLALLGVHRMKPRKKGSPEQNGKIERYHRTLNRWFIKELKHQRVADQQHLQELLDAVLDRVYHEHRHRELKMSPRQALSDRISERQASLERLRDAFLLEKQLTPHRKTGELRISGTLFKVPREYYQPRVKVAVDPEYPDQPYLKLTGGQLLPLELAIKRLEPKVTTPREEPVGSLTPFLEYYRGRRLPLAISGFGLPEIYKAFSEHLGRPVPATEREAQTVSAWLTQCGPFEPQAFHGALNRVLKKLGPGRPLSQILLQLKQMVLTKGDLL